MAEPAPGMFLVAAGSLAVAGAVGYGAFRAFRSRSAGMRVLGSVLALGAFLMVMLALACIVFAFGVDFK